jgi:hypothetical protein
MYSAQRFLSEGYMQHGDPPVAAYATPPMMMNDTVATIFGRGGRDGRLRIASRTAFAARIIVILGQGAPA